MKTNTDHEVSIHFRIIGISLQRIRFYQKLMPQIVFEHQKWKHGRGQIVLIELRTKEVCQTLGEVFDSHPLTVPFGICVSMTTEYDHDGLTIPPYVCELLRKIGGTLDFFFTCIG
jgi:hypothetical protein